MEGKEIGNTESAGGEGERVCFFNNQEVTEGR